MPPSPQHRVTKLDLSPDLNSLAHHLCWAISPLPLSFLPGLQTESYITVNINSLLAILLGALPEASENIALSRLELIV